MRKALDETAIPVTGSGAAAMASDPDDLRLQLLGAPGGLAGTIMPPRELRWTIRRFSRLDSTTLCWP